MEGRREGIGKRGKVFVQMWTKDHIECAPGLLTRGTEERGIHLWALPLTPSNWDVNSFSLLVCMCVSAAWFPKLSNNTNTAEPERQKRESNAESQSSGAPGCAALQLHLQEPGCYSSGWNTRWAKRMMRGEHMVCPAEYAK